MPSRCKRSGVGCIASRHVSHSLRTSRGIDHGLQMAGDSVRRGLEGQQPEQRVGGVLGRGC